MTNLQQKISLVIHLVLLLIVFANAQDTDPATAPSTGFNAQTAITMTVLVSGFFLLGFFSLYIRHCTSVRYHARGGVNILPTGGAVVERGLDAAVIETFPTFTYSSVKGLKIGIGVLECAVCLNEFQDDETLRLIPKCDHVFHPHCIDAWLTSHSTCPVCRADLEPAAGEVVIDVPLNVSEPESESDEPKSKPGSEKMYPGGSDSGSCHEQSPDATDFVLANQNVNVPRRTKSPIEVKFVGIFRRSHTTGHSLDEVRENMERFTLRLPEEVRNQIINSTLNRTKSCVAIPGFGSENRSVWKGFSMTPPFFSRTGSVRSPTLEAAKEAQKSLSRSLKSPFHRLFFGVDRGNSSNDGGVGERSFDRLKTKDVV